MHDKRGKNVELTVTELLSYGTVRIECTDVNNQETAGTGYVVEFEKDGDTNTSITALITNKSVIKGAEKGRLIFTQETEDGAPDDRNHSSDGASPHRKTAMRWLTQLR